MSSTRCFLAWTATLESSFQRSLAIMTWSPRPSSLAPPEATDKRRPAQTSLGARTSLSIL